ncbi:TIR domain-containing adapter molecule 1-like [Hyperolius riggenbachi]|uniref:TIR domain-containing adapter molecule 1-like n=1 Tax=Hyperolius riggenbachi TaxID=752182 RepID=UPI0035A2ABB6
MSRNAKDTDFSDDPHTLCSALQSKEISIGSSHNSFPLISGALQISQSPTRVFTAEPCQKQFFTVDAQMVCTTDNNRDKNSFCKLIAPNTSDFSLTSKQEESSKCSDQQFTENVKMETFSSDWKKKDNNVVQKSIPVSELPREVSPPIVSTMSSHSSYNPLHVQSTSLNADEASSFILSSTSQVEFFSFVILHVPDDLEVACRVCTFLQKLGIGKGITFCEGFETPGVSPLTCLENAVENSAYIILLITDAFLCNWGLFQTNTVLMNSIENEEKIGTVIPFLPKECAPVEKWKLPLCLRSLLPLEEHSSLFTRKVQMTFKNDFIARQRVQWKNKQKVTLQRCLKESHEKYNNCQKLQAISQEYQNIYNLQYPDLNCLSRQIQNPCIMCHGQPHIIQISNAGNVQIGNQNSMNINQSPLNPLMDLDSTSYKDGKNETPS